MLAIATFEHLERALTFVPALHLSNFNKPLTIECDALLEAIRAILL